MLTEETLTALLPLALAGVDLPELGQKIQGKVRDIYQRTRNDRRVRRQPHQPDRARALQTPHRRCHRPSLD